MLTQERLDEIKKRCEVATPGPWTYYVDPEEERGPLTYTDVDGPEMACYGCAKDAEFVAHARTDVPDLLAEVERMKAEVRRHEARIEDLILDNESALRRARRTD